MRPFYCVRDKLIPTKHTKRRENIIYSGCAIGHNNRNNLPLTHQTMKSFWYFEKTGKYTLKENSKSWTYMHVSFIHLQMHGSCYYFKGSL